MQNVYQISKQDSKNAGQLYMNFSTLVSTVLSRNLKGNGGVLKYLHIFRKKISRMKDIVASRLTGLNRNPLEFDKPHVGQPLNQLISLTTDEVYKLIESTPAKSSPMDYLRHLF